MTGSNANPDRTPIGVVGLGNMGLAIAQRLNAEFRVIGTDLSTDRQNDARALGIEISDLSTITTSCTTVLMSLPRPKASLSVVGAIAANPGIVDCVLETSTVTPADIRASKAVLEVRGIELIDAAILSGVAQMRKGTAGLVLAGNRDQIEQLSAVFNALTPNQRILGQSGSAMAAKVINNAVAHVVMVLLSEAVAMTKASGVEITEMIDLLASPDGGLMRPLTHRIGERVLQGDYEGGMSLEAARKDSVLAQQLAQDAAVPLFTIPAAHSVYEMALAAGYAREDYAALAKLWEEWGHTSFIQDKS